MAKNEGKRFEEDISKSVPNDWFCYRLKDSSGSWSNNDKSRFTPKNSCDYFIFNSSLYAVECKSVQGKSIPYSNFRDKQIEDLVNFCNYEYVYGVFFINFRKVNETYMIYATVLKLIMDNSDRKSISIDQCREHGRLIPQQLKRTRYRYDLSVLI